MDETPDICPKCGAQLGTASGPCPACGAPRAFRMTLEPGKDTVEGYPPAIIIDGPDPASGDLRIRVNSPGGTSVTRLSPSDQLSLVVEGAEAGRKSESWAVDTLRTKLTEQGFQVAVASGADDRGEDRLLRVRDQTFVVQVATTPGVPSLWRDASVSSATTQVALHQAVEWLHDTVEAKARDIPRAQRASTILAIDARHAGLLARDTVADLYASRFGSPSQEHGFASVWVIGPIPRYCVRLGEGVP